MTRVNSARAVPRFVESRHDGLSCIRETIEPVSRSRRPLLLRAGQGEATVSIAARFTESDGDAQRGRVAGGT